MTRIILVILIVGISNRLNGQDHPIKELLDSAKFLWYADFNKTDRLIKQAEAVISLPGQKGYEFELLQLYALRIQSCNAFAELQLMRQHLDEFEGLLSKYKNTISAGQYTLFHLGNELVWAQYYHEINDDGKTLEIFDRLIKEYKALPKSADVYRSLRIISNDMAGILSLRGEHEAAINQHLASISYLDFIDSVEAIQTSRSLIYRNIGRVYLQKGDYYQAGNYLRLADDVIQDELKQEPIVTSRIALSLYETQTSYYTQINRNDSALLSMQKAIPLLKLQNIGDEFKGRINHSLGDLYLLEGKFNEAKKCYDQAEVFFLNTKNHHSAFLSRLYLSYAELCQKQGKIDQGLAYCGKAIDNSTLNFKPDIDGNPDLRNVLSKKLLFSALQKKSHLEEKLFSDRKEVNVLLKALHTNQVSLALLDSTANEFGLDKDKIILSEQSYSAFEDAIRISNTLYQKTGEEKNFTNVIALIEKSKGNLLLENLRLVNRFSGIKQEWLEREKALKAEMLWTEQKIYEWEQKAGMSSDLQNYRERYSTIKRDYSALIEQIKREAPDYYKLRFDHSVVSTETIQEKLIKPNEALIEFFVGDSILAVTGFTKDKKYLNVKKMLPDFTAKMNQFRTILTTSNSNFSDLSKEFYDFLLKDCLAEIGTEINSLIIIPDGLLGYLPFEVLIQSKDPKVVYLNDKMSIHYANSATYLMEQMQRKPSEAKNFFAGFVSSGSDQSSGNQEAARDQRLAALQGAEFEVASIIELFSSKFTVFNRANKLDFINYASDYKILHFAMHSLLNDENPMMSVMVFSETDSTENLLTAIELYSMKLNSELAVLSACNTGVGQLHRGEGIMSFSRAFAYAGVPSAVISLWKVPDIATSKIMVSFYSHLKNGESKDKALQLARQDFVRNNLEMAHPFFWSGFILTGNAEAITFPESRWWIWMVVISLVVLTALYVGRKRLKRG